MKPRLNKIQYKRNYIYLIQFTDNKQGEVDLKPFLWGEAFEELKDENNFKKAFIDKTTGTISWPNGSDLAPETLYKKVISEASKNAASV